ncbi:MAG: ABC transporter ATP-binding protein [Bifidobacteriaceae bacterium]|jgi:spermidine/putrescine transport system ATP-binding protein|nr:ABC transporter ATP-binding protein [Bifidobacteriaceae bacterium]
MAAVDLGNPAAPRSVDRAPAGPVGGELAPGAGKPAKPGPAGEAGLSVTGAHKTFRSAEGGEVHALDGVSLDVALGEFYVLLGPSGCGKTTLLRAIAGLEPLDGGEIYLGDERIDLLAPHKRPDNTVFQSYALFPHLSVWENIAFGLKMEKLPKAAIAARVEAMLALVHLSEVPSRRPSQLSGGQQQRVALARALAKQPAVLLLDEPLSALDLKLRRGMQGELKRIQRETGITFVFVTHDQEEALSMGDRIAVFKDGRPAQIGTPEDIYERPVSRFVADFIGDTNFLETELTVRADGLVGAIGGLAVPVGSPGAGAAGPATLAIRPENIVLTDPAEAELRGRLVELTYMGTDLRCAVELPDGQRLRVRVPPPFGGGHLAPGGEVGVVVAPGLAKVVVDS